MREDGLGRYIIEWISYCHHSMGFSKKAFDLLFTVFGSANPFGGWVVGVSVLELGQQGGRLGK